MLVVLSPLGTFSCDIDPQATGLGKPSFLGNTKPDEDEQEALKRKTEKSKASRNRAAQVTKN